VIFGRPHPSVQQQAQLALQTPRDGVRIPGVGRGTFPTRATDERSDTKIAIR
jgi:hypothetical protein